MKYKRKNKNNTCLIDILIEIEAYKLFKNIDKWNEFYKAGTISFQELIEALDFNRIDFFISLPIDPGECKIKCLTSFIEKINKENIYWIYIGYNLNEGHAYLYNNNGKFIDNKNNCLTDKTNKKFHIGNLIGISF